MYFCNCKGCTIASSKFQYFTDTYDGARLSTVSYKALAIKFSILLLVKCEVIEKTSQGESDGKCQIVFVIKYCISRGRNFSGNVAGGRIGALLITS